MAPAADPRVYRTPVVGSGERGDPRRAVHNDEHGASSLNYRTHLRGDVAYVVARFEIPTFEDAADVDVLSLEAAREAGLRERDLELPDRSISSSDDDSTDDGDGDDDDGGEDPDDEGGDEGE